MSDPTTVCPANNNLLLWARVYHRQYSFSSLQENIHKTKTPPAIKSITVQTKTDNTQYNITLIYFLTIAVLILGKVAIYNHNNHVNQVLKLQLRNMLFNNLTITVK